MLGQGPSDDEAQDLVRGLAPQRSQRAKEHESMVTNFWYRTLEGRSLGPNELQLTARIDHAIEIFRYGLENVEAQVR